jgi:polysaccharide export outer membrane protein
MLQRLLRDVPAKFLIGAAAAAAFVSGCSDGPSLPPTGAGMATNAAALQRTYRLGIGDKLKLVVFGEENLSGQFEVNALGQVALPLVGEVPAKGLAIAEFRDAVARRLSDGYLKNPRVTVEVLNYRSIFVHGEVKTGGEFQYKNGLKLRDAIAMAGGYTYRANQDHLFLVREGEQEMRLALPSDVPVLPGDNIRIPERFF